MNCCPHCKSKNCLNGYNGVSIQSGIERQEGGTPAYISGTYCVLCGHFIDNSPKFDATERLSGYEKGGIASAEIGAKYKALIDKYFDYIVEAKAGDISWDNIALVIGKQEGVALTNNSLRKHYFRRIVKGTTC